MHDGDDTHIPTTTTMTRSSAGDNTHILTSPTSGKWVQIFMRI